MLRKPLCPDCAISLKLCNRNSPRFVLPTGFYFEKKKKENPNCFKDFFFFAYLLYKSEPTLRRKSRGPKSGNLGFVPGSSAHPLYDLRQLTLCPFVFAVKMR